LLLVLAITAGAGDQSVTGVKPIALTPRERRWLANHPHLRVAPDPAFPPIEWIDSQGRFKGIAADFLALVEKKLGVRFEIVHLDSWSQVLKQVRQHRVDILSAASPSRQRRRYLRFTRPHIVLPGMIFMRNDVQGTFTLADLHGRRVTVVAQYVWQDYLTNDYPELILIPAPSAAAALKMVSFGQVEAMVGNLATATYYLRKEGITNLRVAGKTEYFSYLSLASRKDWPMLHTLLDKALAAISPQESQAILDRWIHIRRRPWFASTKLWFGLIAGLGLMILLLVGVAVINRLLSRKVSQRTKELTSELSERQRAEEALLDSEERLRLLADNLPNAMVYQIVVEPGRPRRVTYVSANVQRLNEVTPEAVLADPEVLYRQVLPEYRKEMLAKGRQSLKDLTTFHCEVCSRLPSGRLRWFDLAATPRRLSDGRVVWDGVQVDITDRKEAEAKIQQSEARFRAIFENAPVGMALVDTKRRFLQVNAQLCNALGYQPEELVGRSFNQFTHPEDRQGGRDRWQELLTGNVEFNQAEKRYLHKDGHVVWVLVANTLIRNSEGEPLYFISHLVDISARKQAAEEKARLEAQLRQSHKMEAIGVLSSGIAHDFNNLLQAINGYTDLLLHGRPDDDPEYHKLARIRTAGNRAARLIEQLLLFSRKTEPERRPLDLNREVEQTIRILERTIPKMIDIEFHPAEDLWTINADPVQIEQVVLNLGANAADAMPDGGKLIIESHNVTLSHEYTSEHLGIVAGEYVCLTVTDTGLGMDQETTEHIFEPFFTTKGVGKGTGLGLASVYGIVQGHDGFIHCYSEAGLGTTFKIYLPVIEPGRRRDPRPATVTPAAQGSETILLVDDDEAVREFAAQVLQNAGYSVVQAASGEEALETYTAGRQEIDLVILDIGMPGMGGHLCLQKILNRDPQAKIVIASGYSLNGLVKKTLQSGAAAYLGKPYQLADLLGTVRQVLDGGPPPPAA